MQETEPRREPITGLWLREFVEADDAEVSRWFADAGELRFFAGPRLRWPLDAGQWRSIRLDSSVIAWTAVLGDDPTPVGHAEMVRESAVVVRLARLAVAPPLRGQGIARAVMSQLIQLCRDAGFVRVTLATHPDNTMAIRTYRTFGFEPARDPATSSAPGISVAGSRVAGSPPDRMLLALELDQRG